VIKQWRLTWMWEERVDLDKEECYEGENLRSKVIGEHIAGKVKMIMKYNRGRFLFMR